MDDLASAEKYAIAQAALLKNHVYSMAQLLPLASIKQEFLIEGAVPTRAITVLVAPPGSMKSWLAYDMALAVVRKEPWMGFTVNFQGPALLLNYDNPTPELGRRLLRLGAKITDPIFAHTAISWQAMLQFPGYYEEVLAITRAVKPRLIIIDSLRQAHTMDESDSKDMSKLMNQLKRLTELGAAVVLIHHSRKSPAGATVEDQLAALESMRGSGEIAASADCVIAVRERRATWIKTRGWYVADEDRTLDFDVVDKGDRTLIVAAEGEE